MIKPIVTDTVSLAKTSVAHAFGQRFLDLRRLVSITPIMMPVLVVQLCMNSRVVFCDHIVSFLMQIPQKELPSYKPREHLKGSDAALVERVKAEVLAAHGDKLAAIGVDTKTILLEGRRG